MPNADEITAILTTGKFVHRAGQNGYLHIEWSGPKVKARAWELARELGANVDQQPGDCPPCNLVVVNALRLHIGWPVLAEEVSPPLHEARLAICRTCPAYHTSTHSCGRLILDAISPKPVTIDGHEVNPCGCLVDAKARFPNQICPADKWPKAA